MLSWIRIRQSLIMLALGVAGFYFWSVGAPLAFSPLVTNALAQINLNTLQVLYVGLLGIYLLGVIVGLVWWMLPGPSPR